MNIMSFWILPLLMYGGMATAAPTGEALAAYRQASERFQLRIAEAEAGGKAAQLRDAEFSRLVEVLSDEHAMLVESPDSAEKVESIMEICEISNKATMSLVLFDLKASIAPSQDQQVLLAKFNALMTRNVLQFQDELMELHPFMLRCLAKQIRSLEPFIASLPPEDFTEVRRSGVVKMRRGILMAFQGALLSAKDNVLEEGYRLTTLSALAGEAEAYAQAVPLSDRKQIADAAGFLSREEGALGAYAAQIEHAFRSMECTTLCSVE